MAEMPKTITAQVKIEVVGGADASASVRAVADILEERARQCSLGYDAAHDDSHSLAELGELVSDHGGGARVQGKFAVSRGEGGVLAFERECIQTAACALAALESSRRRRGA